MTLSDAYCASLRPKLVSTISTDDVLSVLKPVWLSKNETASRLRGRIERVLDFARVKGWRAGENPAAWRGNLRNLLPKRQKFQRGHQPAMRYQDVPAFVRRLRPSDAMAARALEFVILTVGRSGEVLGAKWSEIDLEQKVWNVPKERMKAGIDHVVPLSAHASRLLEALHVHRISECVFPRTKDKPLSGMAMLMLLPKEVKLRNADRTDRIVVLELQRYIPPDVRAIIFWLTNRKPEHWKFYKPADHPRSPPQPSIQTSWKPEARAKIDSYLKTMK